MILKLELQNTEVQQGNGASKPRGRQLPTQNRSAASTALLCTHSSFKVCTFQVKFQPPPFYFQAALKAKQGLTLQVPTAAPQHGAAQHQTHGSAVSPGSRATLPQAAG